jgi:hypothetical protein
LTWVVIGLAWAGCGGSGGGGGGGGSSGGGGSWTKAPVNSDVSTRSIAIALDAAGAPHVAFIDEAVYPGQVYYGSFAGGSWSAAPVPGTTSADEEIDLVIDPQGHPRLAYQSENGIRYASSDGSTWTVEVVENQAVGARNPSLSLALTSTGAPAISFYGGDNFGLKYATRSGGGAWSVATVDSALYAGYHGTSLAFDASDRPLISYYNYAYDVAERGLRLLRYSGGAWSSEVVDVTPATADTYTGVGEWSSMALDAAGHPHVAYLDGFDGTVKYAWYDGSGWTRETVGPGYIDPSLALGPDGTPWIAFVESAMSWVNVAHRAGVPWTIDRLPASGDWCVDLALDAAGARHVAFDDGSTAAAMYATRR